MDDKYLLFKYILNIILFATLSLKKILNNNINIL